MGQLKLFVVGDNTGEPERWAPWGGYMLVMAHDAEEARRLDAPHYRDAFEVCVAEPAVIARIPIVTGEF